MDVAEHCAAPPPRCQVRLRLGLPEELLELSEFLRGALTIAYRLAILGASHGCLQSIAAALSQLVRHGYGAASTRVRLEAVAIARPRPGCGAQTRGSERTLDLTPALRATPLLTAARMDQPRRREERGTANISPLLRSPSVTVGPNGRKMRGEREEGAARAKRGRGRFPLPSGLRCRRQRVAPKPPPSGEIPPPWNRTTSTRALATA